MQRKTVSASPGRDREHASVRGRGAESCATLKRSAFGLQAHAATKSVAFGSSVGVAQWSKENQREATRRRLSRLSVALRQGVVPQPVTPQTSIATPTPPPFEALQSHYDAQPPPSPPSEASPPVESDVSDAEYESVVCVTSPLYRKLVSSYRSLYQIARTSLTPHLLCLPVDGEAWKSDDCVNYYDVQCHLLAPEMASPANVGRREWDGFTYRSLRSDGTIIEVLELEKSTQEAKQVELHLRRNGQADIVIEVKEWRKLPNTEVVVVWVSQPLAQPSPLRGEAVLTSIRNGASAMTPCSSTASLQDETTNQSFASVSSAASTMTSPPGRKKSIFSLLNGIEKPAAQPQNTESCANIGSFAPMASPQKGMSRSMVFLSGKKATKTRAATSSPREVAERKLHKTTTEIDEEMLIMNTHYFFPPKQLSHLITQKVSGLCERWSREILTALASLAASEAEQGSEQLGEEVEHDVHEYVLGALRGNMIRHWWQMHEEEDRLFSETCHELVNLSFEEWQIPEEYRGAQTRAVEALRNIHKLPTPLAMGRQLVAVISMILTDAVVVMTASNASMLASEASADLLLPLLIRVIVLAAGEELLRGTVSPGATCAVPFISTMSFARDFACPSMGYSDVAYSLATFEAATEFISSGSCTEFCITETD